MLPEPGGVPQTADLTRSFKDHKPRGVWVNWFDTILRRVMAAASRLNRTAFAAIAAAVVQTPLDTGSLNTGLYRISYYARCVQAATTSSSLGVNIFWTDGGVACSVSGTILNGNTVTSTRQQVFIVRADVGTTIDYSLTYGSIGATPGLFDAEIHVESLQ